MKPNRQKSGKYSPSGSKDCSHTVIKSPRSTTQKIKSKSGSNGADYDENTKNFGWYQLIEKREEQKEFIKRMGKPILREKVCNTKTQ